MLPEEMEELDESGRAARLRSLSHIENNNFNQHSNSFIVNTPTKRLNQLSVYPQNQVDDDGEKKRRQAD